MRDRALAKNERVKTMVEALRKLGCDPGPLESFIQCASVKQHNGMAMTGGFEVQTDPEVPFTPRIVMIQENLSDQEVFDRTLIHELVHAYDQCRAKVDWRNRRHVACTEIRASNLSGECEFLQEINRGRIGFLKHQQACVRRRAALSVSMHGVSDSEARQTVESVYARCYHDTAPFPQYHNRPAI